MRRDASPGGRCAGRHPPRWVTPSTDCAPRAQNLGDGIDYGQQKQLTLGDLITSTLELFEMHGGEVNHPPRYARDACLERCARAAD